MILKYVGNIVIQGKHIKSIKIDHRMEKIYQEKATEIREAASKEELKQ